MSEKVNNITLAWDEEGLFTSVRDYDIEKKYQIYNDLRITETKFATSEPSEVVYDKLFELNQSDLHGVYIYDEPKNAIIYRTTGHIKAEKLKGTESKIKDEGGSRDESNQIYNNDSEYFQHLRMTDYHRDAKSRYFSK